MSADFALAEAIDFVFDRIVILIWSNVLRNTRAVCFSFYVWESFSLACWISMISSLSDLIWLFLLDWRAITEHRAYNCWTNERSDWWRIVLRQSSWWDEDDEKDCLQSNDRLVMSWDVEMYLLDDCKKIKTGLSNSKERKFC